RRDGGVLADGKPAARHGDNRQSCRRERARSRCLYRDERLPCCSLTSGLRAAEWIPAAPPALATKLRPNGAAPAKDAGSVGRVAGVVRVWSHGGAPGQRRVDTEPEVSGRAAGKGVACAAFPDVRAHAARLRARNRVRAAWI